MAAFIYVELSQDLPYSYQKPVLDSVKKQFPNLDSLDLDAFSGEFFVNQACQLVEIVDRCGVYFKSSAPDTPRGVTLRLAEILIRRQQPTLVILEGSHTWLERLFNNRPALIFLKNPEELTLQEHLNLLYSNA